jgi:hypothetical protein
MSINSLKLQIKNTKIKREEVKKQALLIVRTMRLVLKEQLDISLIL